MIAVGHSMGGTLGLLLAGAYPLAGLALLAAPIDYQSMPVRYANRLKYVMPYTDQSDRSTLPGIVMAEQARRGEPQIGRVRYDRWSTAAVFELYQLMTAARQSLSQVSVPLLLVYSAGDPTVPHIQADFIAENVSSTSIERHVLTQSGHILPQDIERDTVFDIVSRFTASLK